LIVAIAHIESNIVSSCNAEGRNMTNNISLLELINIFTEQRNNIIINLKHLQENYQRQSIKRIPGIRAQNGKLIQPWLQTEYIDNSDYVDMGEFEINRYTANINLLIKRRVKLVKAEDNSPVIEVAGLLANDLNIYNNYTIVCNGEINIKSLQIKISNKKTFDLFKSHGLVTADKFDFRDEYTVSLDNLPLVPQDISYSSIDGLFDELAPIKVIYSIISAHIKGESDVFTPEQIEDLETYYISNNLYLNFPTTNDYTNLAEALANGTVDSRVSYKIDIGSKDILNLSKLHSANKFLQRMYRAYDKETGEIFTKANWKLAFNQNIAFRKRLLSSRICITKVDELMQKIFDDVLGLEHNGIVAENLAKVGAENLIQVLEDKQSNHQISKEEMIAALGDAKSKIENYIDHIYRNQISPLVFYIGATGKLPDNIVSSAMNSEELAHQYANLKFSRNEKTGTFFVIGNTIISIYPQTEYYSKQVNVAIQS
jgi:hypothetical protein